MTAVDVGISPYIPREASHWSRSLMINRVICCLEFHKTAEQGLLRKRSRRRREVPFLSINVGHTTFSTPSAVA
jgi:hypothetical protein